MAFYSQIFTTITFLILTTSSFFQQSILCSQENQESLLSFKSVLSDPSNAMSSWNKSTHFCLWKGIKCVKGEVAELNLEYSNLVGPICPSLGNLSFLKILRLSNNKLNGEIPMALGSLSFLKTLDLSNNSLFGRIPLFLGNLSGLKTLHLGRNSLFGRIPLDLGNLSSLVYLNLSKNDISGEMPSFDGNMGSLSVLDLSFNDFEGSSIPSSFGRLFKLTWLRLLYCNISGVFPPSIWNISSLVSIMVGGNALNGTIPKNIGHTLPDLEKLYLYENLFYGSLSASLSNTSLTDIQIVSNYFSGTIPPQLGTLKNVKRFIVSDNLLEARESRDWIFFNAISNSSVLLLFDISYNKLKGELPPSIANISKSVKYIVFHGNEIWGKIPSEIGYLIHLLGFVASNNKLSGPIPTTFGKLSNLGRLTLSNNNFIGEIPSTLGNLTQLSELDLSSNHLNGTIPRTLGQLQHSQLLNLSNNELIGGIPKEIIDIYSLSQYLDLSNNLLTGPIPSEVGNLQTLVEFHAENNNLSGEIPVDFGNCQLLQYLYLHGNSFRGNIPSSFKALKAIQEMDLSSNNLSGNIPNFFEEFNSLYYLNISFNSFSGEVPKTGIFANLSGFDIRGNNKLCGGIEVLNLPPCYFRSNTKDHIIILISSITISVVIIIAITCFAILLLFRFKSRKTRLVNSKTEFINEHHMISYRELFNATNGFSKTNLLGVGGSSSVYKGELHNENNGPSLFIAIKVFNLKNSITSTNFNIECEAMRNLRHRNILKAITSCSSIDHNGNDFKAIVYEYMPNGSLNDWLHDNKTLNLEQRLSISLDVVSVLDYLHNHSGKQIVHCDLKPSNILLDSEMVACVGDFGLARFVAGRDEISRKSEISVGFKGTIGYAPPEYGVGSEISMHGDIYSFGIVLLEMVTGKRPTDDKFRDGLSLHEYVKFSFPNNITSIIDETLLVEIGDYEVLELGRTKLMCVSVMLEIGLQCSDEFKGKRLRTRDITDGLNAIREILLKQT